MSVWQHFFQQQSLMKNMIMVPAIITPGVVNVQCSDVTSFVRVLSSGKSTSASNFPAIWVLSFSMAAQVAGKVCPSPIKPLGVDLNVLCLVGRDDVVHGPDVTA